MDLLILVACVGVVWWGVVSLIREGMDAYDAYRACKHADTAWGYTPDGIVVTCNSCRAYVGTWEWSHVPA